MIELGIEVTGEVEVGVVAIEVEVVQETLTIYIDVMIETEAQGILGIWITGQTNLVSVHVSKYLQIISS